MGALLCLALLLPGAPAARAAETDRDLERAPPWIFFPAPDEETSRAIDALLTNSFGDFNKVVPARDALVRRFHVWSVPRLALELAGPVNEPALLNTLLTVIALREHVGPAPELAPLLRPLVEIARSGAEPWRRAFALLALGAFRGADGLGRPRLREDKLLPSDPVAEARRAYTAEVPLLLRSALRDPSVQVRVCAALALGKTGGALSRFDLIQGQTAKEASTEPELARIVALGLLSEGADFEQDRSLTTLADSSTRVRAAAGLAIALQAMADDPPDWTGDPERALLALASSRVSRSGADAAEAVFARGCLAALAQRADIWEEVLASAVEGTAVDTVAIAAAQALVGCDHGSLHVSMLQQLTGNTKALKHPVLAAFLLRAGWNATPDGVRACREWLGSAAREPRADRDWDPRWHASLGLLRALAEGRPADPAERREVVAALEAAAERGLHREAPMLPELASLLRTHKTQLLTSSVSRLPEAALRAVEAVVRCRYHLLTADLRDTAVARANAMIYDVIFDLGAIRALAGGAKDKDGSAKRYLEKYLSAWPYLSRLDVLVERGRRPPPALRFDDPAKVLDRR